MSCTHFAGPSSPSLHRIRRAIFPSPSASLGSGVCALAPLSSSSLRHYHRETRHDFTHANTPVDTPASPGNHTGSGAARSSAVTSFAHRLQRSPWSEGEREDTSFLSHRRPTEKSSRTSVSAAAAATGSVHGHTTREGTHSFLKRESRKGAFSPQLQRQRQTRPRRAPFPTTVVTSSSAPHLTETPEQEAPNATTTATTTAAARTVSSALVWSIGSEVADVQDDDIVLDTPASLLPCIARATQELQQSRAQQEAQQRRLRQQPGSTLPDHDDVTTPEMYEFAHPAARGVGQDVIDLVTDVFTAQREAEVAKRREVLYELTHPNPMDYTYDGKLVPPPPLSFGQVTEEARSLGNKMMLGQTYSMVRQAGTRASADDFSSPATAHASVAASPASTIETAIRGPTSAFSPRQHKALASAAPYRSRAREENVFRDHNYFFEINELYQEIVLVGKACAGKSSLLNSLLGQNVAKTSSNPNTTRKISFYQSVTPEQLHAFHAKEHHNQLVKLPGGGLQLTFVDMPGYGIEGMSDQWRDAAIELTDAYFGVRRSVNTVLYCMDCERGLTKTDMKYFEWLENVQGTFFVVLTKCDSVPHSRVTSVMRQVYTLITKNRRKYRKVFPFIIPTSAKDGTNMELLRGLITETSGLIPGDKLRDLLKQKKEAFTQTALLEEAGRIDAARQLERAQAHEFFQLTRGGGSGGASATASTPMKSASATPGNRNTEMELADISSSRLPSNATSGAHPQRSKAASATASLSAPPSEKSHQQNRSSDSGSRKPQRYVLGIGDADTDVSELLFLNGHDMTKGTDAVFPTPEAAAADAAQARRERRERFLAWRRAHPLDTVMPSYDGQNELAEVSPVEGANYESNERGSDGAVRADRRAQEKEHVSCSGGRAAQDEGGAKGRNGRRYRLHTGLDNPQAAQAVLDIPENSTAGNHEGDELQSMPTDEKGLVDASAPPTPPPAAARSSIIGFTSGAGNSAAAAPPRSTSSNRPPVATSSGSGAVSRFLDVLEEFGQQPNKITSAKQRRKEARWLQKRQGKGKGSRHNNSSSDTKSAAVAGGLLAEDASGRLSPYQAGKPCGPALVSPTTAIEHRQAQFRAAQLKELMMQENPEAPWQAIEQLRRKAQARQEEAALSGMRKKEVAAYLRDAGRVTESFDKFEGEVTTAKYMNEVRQAPTLRSQQQMHLNATAKINYRSMPPGLWKRYGEKDTYWPTKQVLGRAQDESHKPQGGK